MKQLREKHSCYNNTRETHMEFSVHNEMIGGLHISSFLQAIPVGEMRQINIFSWQELFLFSSRICEITVGVDKDL